MILCIYLEVASRKKNVIPTVSKLGNMGGGQEPRGGTGLQNMLKMWLKELF
jgi:hypothetical protein